METPTSYPGKAPPLSFETRPADSITQEHDFQREVHKDGVSAVQAHIETGTPVWRQRTDALSGTITRGPKSPTADWKWWSREVG